MRKAKVFGLSAFLIVLLVAAFSPLVLGEISLHAENSGEAEWWYRGQHDEVCSNGGDYCDYADHWGVELATYFDDDWAAVYLDTASRFTIDEVDNDVGIIFTMVSPPDIQTASGPSVAFWLYDSVAGKDYIAISQAAANPQTHSAHVCQMFNAGAVNWWWGEAQATADEVDPASISNVQTGSFTTMRAALSGYDVKAAMILMGVVGSTVGGDGANAVGTGKAVVDNFELTWDSGSYGGTYHIERPWDDTIGFDDWAQGAPPPNDPPREFDKWCLCDHCLQVDDQNLWGLVAESDFEGNPDVPAAAKDFPSGEYALYFGTPTTGDYDRGEAAAGVICSPWNEINPGDKYVTLSFKYFREVEQYMGAYDWTYVQISFDDWSGLAWDPFSVSNPGDVTACSGGDWKTVWYEDSSDANEGDWADAVITHYLDDDEQPYSDDDHRIIIPPNATRMRIRFGFNSVDGANNDNFGWLIDDIVKEHTPEPTGCRIVTEHLDQATVGEKYDFDLDPQVIDGATTGPRAWSIVSVTKDGQRMSGLPRRLALDPKGRLYGEPDPGTSGTYEIVFRLECRDGRPDEKTLILNIRAPTGAGAVNEIATQDFDDGAGDCNKDGNSDSNTWTVGSYGPIKTTLYSLENLWHETDGGVKYALSGAALAEYCNVAYFGHMDAGTPTCDYDPNYNTDGRVKGCLYSPMYPIKAEWDGEELVVGFKSWRNVEYYTGGEYDKTWVQFRFEGGSWQTIWERSSKDKSLAAWTWQEIHTGILLKKGVKIQLRFCFDSVDGYSNGEDGQAWGWLIDEISLYAGGAELSISNCPKEETSVGEYYHEVIHASGGSNIQPIWEISSGQLPPGLGLIVDSSDRRKAHIEGTPRTAGTYSFTIRVRDQDWDEVATRSCRIVVGEEVTLLYEDFEDDPTWSQGGLWHITADAGVECVPELGAGNHAAYYGQNDATDPNYNTGARTSGMLTLVSPVVDLTGVDAVKILFDYWRQVESYGSGGYDVTQVQVKLDDNDWVTVWDLDSAAISHDCEDDWTRDVEIGPFLTDGAATLAIRFVFDSVDKWYNDYIGWLVDNVRIQSAPAGSANPLSAMSRSRLARPRDLAAELEVINVPNPIRDVHTTTFMVRNVDVEAMKIEIYDLGGTLVFEEEVQGNELVWHTDNDYGEYLANGVYIYRAYVLIDGKWIVTKAQKLLILR